MLSLLPHLSPSSSCDRVMPWLFPVFPVFPAFLNSISPISLLYF